MVDKTKVLICSPKKNTGGISMWTRHILNYYSSVEATPVEVDWYYKDSSKDALGGGGIIKRIVAGVTQYIPLVRGVKKHLKSQHYDILHISSSASLGLLRDLWLLRICKKLNVKSVVHLHFGRIPTLFNHCGWEYKLLRKVICLASKVIVMDESSYDVLINNGYHNVELLPNPLSPSIVSLIESNSNIPREKNKVVFVGHVVNGKGIMELVEACKQLSSIMEGISLNVLGLINDEMVTTVQTAAGENHEKWLHICGNQTMDVVIKEMLSSSVFALPTYSEGFPNVILESMACGCPILTTPVGAIPEMLAINSNTPCGVCVEVRNVTQLKDALHRLLTNCDESAKLGEAAKQRVMNEYYIDVIGTRLTNIWQSI